MPGTKRKIDAAPGRPGACAAADASVVMQLAALKRMTVVDLKTKWESLFGAPAPNNSRSYLELRLGYRIQELTLGGFSRETRRTLDLLADETEGQAKQRSIIADPRNPPRPRMGRLPLLRPARGAEGKSMSRSQEAVAIMPRHQHCAIYPASRARKGSTWSSTASTPSARPAKNAR